MTQNGPQKKSSVALSHTGAARIKPIGDVRLPARAQETLKGEVVAIDRASKKISIKLGGTVAPSDTTAPTPFKIQDALMFDAVKLGDKFSFQHANPAPDGIFGRTPVRPIRRDAVV
jgi:Cu/Ag efflux protein CusF